MRNENQDVLKMHVNCKVAQELLTDDILKSNQCAIDGGSSISKTLEIDRESKALFECMHANTKMRLKKMLTVMLC